MRAGIALSVTVVGLLMTPASVTAARAVGDGPASAAPTCRSQSFTYVKGRKPPLSSALGPRLRTTSDGTVSLTDNQVLAQYQPVNNGVPAKYLNVTTSNPENSRLESVVLYPAKGKRKTFKVVANSDKDFVYKYDLLKDYGQVMLPVTGNDGNAVPPRNSRRW